MNFEDMEKNREEELQKKAEEEKKRRYNENRHSFREAKRRSVVEQVGILNKKHFLLTLRLNEILFWAFCSHLNDCASQLNKAD